MARIRTIKPEIWLSAQVMNLSHSARLLFVGLITQADDDGRGSADARRLKAAIFGGDDCTAADVGDWLRQVEAQGLAILYSDDDHGALYQLTGWQNHQSIDRPRKSNYPPPPSSSRRRKPPGDSSSGSTNERRTDAEGSRDHARGSEGPEGRKDLQEGRKEGEIHAGAREPLGPDEQHELVERLRAEYPKNPHNPAHWQNAGRNAVMIVDNGLATAEFLIEQTVQFRKLQEAIGNTGARAKYVPSPSKFFEFPRGPWQHAIEIPPDETEEAHAAIDAVGSRVKLS